MNTQFSSQELRMFKDKDLKKIKPIKTKFKTKKENKEDFFPFIESGTSVDSSIFKIVSQIHWFGIKFESYFVICIYILYMKTIIIKYFIIIIKYYGICL